MSVFTQGIYAKLVTDQIGFGVTLSDGAIASVDGPIIGVTDVDPNGVVTANDGALLLGRAASAGFWRNDGGGTTWILESNSGNTPAGVITVATSGGNYTSIQEGMDNAAAGQTVLVYPGTYAESIDFTGVAANVRVTGFPNAQNVIIAGADATSTRVTLSQPGTLREITVVGPSGGANPAIDCTGLGVGELAVLFNAVLRGGGAGHTGPLFRGAGSGEVAAIQGLYHNGGTTSGNFFECTGGTCVGADWIANVGTCAAVVSVSGGVLRLQNLQLQDNTLYSCTSAIEISGGAIQAQSIVVPEGILAPCSNGLRIRGDGVSVDITDAQFSGSTFDFLADSGLTGSGSALLLGGCDFEKSKASFPSTWLPDRLIVSYLDRGTGGDNPGSKFVGNVDIGTTQFPASLSAGTGDSTTLNMRAYTYDSSAGSFNNVTGDLQSNDGVTATWAVDQDDGIFIYCDGFKPRMMDIENVVAAVSGAGALSVEVVTGVGPITSTVMNYMSADADSHVQYAKTILARPNANENARFDTKQAPWTTWPTTDPASSGTAAYVLWIRNLGGALATSPTIDRVKWGDSFWEQKSTGTNRFGTAEPVRTFVRLNGESLSSPTGGVNAPQVLDVTISTNVTYRLSNSLYPDGSDARQAGAQFQLPLGIDTSRPTQFVFTAYTDGTDINAVEIDLYVTVAPASGASPTETPYTPTFTPTGTAGIGGRQTVEVDIDLSEAVAGDTIGFVFNPQRATDANPDDFAVLNFAWQAAFYD